MKTHNQYSFNITYSGMEFNCEVNGIQVAIPADEVIVVIKRYYSILCGNAKIVSRKKRQ